MLELIRRASDWWNRDRLSEELDEELRFHRAMLERDHYATRRLGNVTSIKERARDVWNPAWLDELAHDVRLASRVLRRRAAFSTTAIATLALALGANTLIFTIVDRALLRPLPYLRAGELVAVSHHDRQLGRNDKATGAEVATWHERTDVFSDVAYSWDAQYTLTSAAPPLTLRAFQFSTNLLAMLGARPLLGRTFVRGDDAPGNDHVVVLSEHLWRSAFGASPEIVGRTIHLDAVPYLVVGVMPRTFAHPDLTTDLWTPLAMPQGLVRDTTLRAFNVVARLAPRVTSGGALRAMTRDVSLRELRDVYLGPARPVIWLLQGAVILLLLIATANVANLVLAHATSVEREVALRQALGASRARLVRQFVTEGLVLSAAGCGIGIAVANVGADAIPASLRQSFGAMPSTQERGVSWPAVAVAVAVAMSIAVVFGLLMTFSSHASSGNAPRSDARAATTRRRVAAVRETIVSAQIAVSLLLLASSGLLIKSFLKLEHRSLGFATADRLTLSLQPPPNRYPDGLRTAAYLDQVLARIRAVPGVQSAAATSAIPLTGMDARRRLVRVGARDSAGQSVVHFRVVSPDYFATLGIPVLRGRGFAGGDRAGAGAVALINETLARARWLGENPVGKIVTIAGGPVPETVEVVGVVGDVRHDGLATDPQPEIYRPTGQAYWPFFGIIVKSAIDAASLTKAVEEAVWSVDRMQPIDRVETMDVIASQSVALRRVSMMVLSSFAAAAALLAAIGIYGIVSYVVSLRTREIGIRVALGARPSDVMRRIVAAGARRAVAGGALGIAATYALTRYLASLLFGVMPTDVGTIAVAFTLTVGIAVLASYLPARRASSIDPALTLRME